MEFLALVPQQLTYFYLSLSFLELHTSELLLDFPFRQVASSILNINELVIDTCIPGLLEKTEHTPPEVTASFQDKFRCSRYETKASSKLNVSKTIVCLQPVNEDCQVKLKSRHLCLKGSSL